MTQFAFDYEAMLTWVEQVRNEGFDAPIRLGVPGPTSVKRLLSFAARCGVGASASVMKKYGFSITQLLTTAGPDKLVNNPSGIAQCRERVCQYVEQPVVAVSV